MGRNGKPLRYKLNGDIHGKNSRKELEYSLPAILGNVRSEFRDVNPMRDIAYNGVATSSSSSMRRHVNVNDSNSSRIRYDFTNQVLLWRYRRQLAATDVDACNAPYQRSKKKHANTIITNELNSLNQIFAMRSISSSDWDLDEFSAVEDTLDRCYLPSLTSICVQSIAKSLEHYSIEELSVIFASFDPLYLYELSLHAALHQTLTDQSMALFGANNASMLCLSNFSDASLTSLINCSNRLHGTVSVSSWDDEDFTCTPLPSKLHHLTVIDSSHNLSISLLQQYLLLHKQLEVLSLHNIGLQPMESNPFIGLMNSLVGSLPSLRRIELSYCSWVTIPALINWIRVFHGRRADSLQLSIHGVEDVDDWTTAMEELPCDFKRIANITLSVNPVRSITQC